MINARETVVARPHHVYRFYDVADRLLYVGCTSLLAKRMSGHRGKPYWSDVSRVEIAGPMPPADAFYAEQQAILNEHPAWNRRRIDTRSLAEIRTSLAFGLALHRSGGA